MQAVNLSKCFRFENIICKIEAILIMPEWVTWGLIQNKDVILPRASYQYMNSHHADIKNNAWVTVWITIFGSRVSRFANNFHEWRSHEWKSLANRITSDPKIVMYRNECIILFHSWSVTSRECRTLALWRHIRRLFLHAQIGAKAIFTSE